VRVASAPVTWGVWEKTAGRDDLVPPELLLETMRGLGYVATELGPPGYFSPQMLEEHDMALAGGFAPLRFEDDAGFREDVETWLDPVIESLLATGARGPAVLAGGELAGPHEPPDAAYFDRVDRAVDRCRSRRCSRIRTSASVTTRATHWSAAGTRWRSNGCAATGSSICT